MSIMLYRIYRLDGQVWAIDTDHRAFTDKTGANRVVAELQTTEPNVRRVATYFFVFPDGTEILDGICQWFALCRNDATGVMDVPGLGATPICDRCRKVLAL